jgi:hypothetical protein
MEPNEEQNQKFEKWVLFIRKNFDVNTKEFLRYIWNLYDELIDQIKELKKKYNGKEND